VNWFAIVLPCPADRHPRNSLNGDMKGANLRITKEIMIARIAHCKVLYSAVRERQAD